MTQELDGFSDEKARLARFNQLAAAVLQQRDLLTHRVLVQGKSVDGVIRALEAASEEKSAEPSDAILVHDRDTVAADKAKTAFVFSGNGSQWLAWGRFFTATIPCSERLLTKLMSTLSRWQALS